MSNSPVGLSSLVERVRRGEIAALGTLYENEAPHLLALALRLTADQQAAEAVVHEVFCTLWRNPDAVGRDVRGYLLRNTLKVVEASTVLRRRKRLVSRVRRREEPLDLRSRE
jgi:DNA-directed RNA polymerase specialized sigma24 family protein